MITSRELALKILYEIDVNGAYSNIQINKEFNKQEISQIEKDFATELIYGVTKWRLTLDSIISELSSVKIKKITPWILNILRLGIYQIKYLDKIPESAAVNECVKLAKKYGHAGTIKFVNGLLRNYTRNAENIKYNDKSNKTKYLSIEYSHPEWLVERWLKAFGYDFTEKLLEANNIIPSLTIRVNTLKCNFDELMHRLAHEGINAEEGRYFTDSMIVKSSGGIVNSQAYKDGLFQIQDESSMLVGKIANPTEGQTVLDVCAAPGGKSTHLAQLMKNIGKVYSRDIHEHKISLITNNAKRLGISIIEAQIFDATKFDQRLKEKMDCVLVDAPCSGLGIIRRKPDIKWKDDINDKNDLINIQKTILSTSSQYVKTGGTLVYSTCTIENDENIDIIKDFLSKNDNFLLDDITEYVPKKLQKETCKNGYIQLYPNVDDIDGFFVCRMKRVK